MNLDLLKKGSVSDIASIVRCLYHRSKVKELPIQERKLSDKMQKRRNRSSSERCEGTRKKGYIADSAIPKEIFK